MLRVRGARHHNLRNIDVDIPKNSIVVISGLSGSGKSTLAFDTIYAEGQRRYVESLSSYARQFLGMMDKPEVDSIEGLSPAISIQQKTTSKNPRSTVGTTTEIYDYMRLLFARVGVPHCTKCGRTISSQSVDTITDTVLQEFAGRQLTILAPLISRKKGTYEKLMDKVRMDGYSRIRIDGEVYQADGELPSLDRQKWHNIEIAVDRLRAEASERSRLFEGIQTAIRASGGRVLVAHDGGERIFSQDNACPHCGISIGELEPRTFSFNSPFGMCNTCSGLGTRVVFDPELVIPDRSLSILDGAIAPWNVQDSQHLSGMIRKIGKEYGFGLDTPVGKIGKAALDTLLYGTDDLSSVDMTDPAAHEGRWSRGGVPYEGVIQWLHRGFMYTESESKREWLRQFMRETPCSSCKGRKLRPEALAVKVGAKSIMEICDLSIDGCHTFFEGLKLSKTEQHIVRDLMREIRSRLGFLRNVGLNYLTLNRTSSTLSGGESQRIRLATQIGSNLTGVLYVLDEPTIGLHQRDNARLIKTLEGLKKLGNTVIVVEHDEEVIRSSDWIIDLGPGAGVHGGSIVFEGTVKEILDGHDSVTGRYLKDKSLITVGEKGRVEKGAVTVKGASENNLRGIDVKFPLGLFISVTGVSGSGKSTLVNEILLKALQRRLHGSRRRPGRHKSVSGTSSVDKVIAIDQSPIGRTPRSNPATYVGAFTPMRVLYTGTELSRQRGYKPGQFSFNVEGGRCFACEGDGVKRIEMQFLSDVYVRCDECKGRRYNSETLGVLYKGRSIADVLEMTVDEALDFFGNVPAIRRKLELVRDVGLGYIKLGQPSTTLSGGEAQRVKLALELSKRSTGSTVYVLDEPTTGLHFADVQKLLDVLNRLADLGNTIVVIEHNMDVIRNSDWVIDLGPEGGDGGGRIVAQGTPVQVAATATHTGRYLKKFMA
ncbi:excinuclease ATPase subunit [Cenarchaeum symbiosum A]|uniref:Excinuclease ATPase subunit n=1 Tax=Cenarchaeum symbiosum (strain A) TaxID=414004 RepID=A0RV10_CENSY|nr:excinuclease ATPase subunit [Cenarchaeum symbiosum A]